MASPSPTQRTDGTGLVDHDPWLEPYSEQLRARHRHYLSVLSTINAGGGLEAISRGHHYFGLNRGDRDGQPGVWYREWAPAAHKLALTGDFNGWDRQSHPLERDQFGVWSIFLADKDYAGRLTHGSLLKVHVSSAIGGMDRIPAYIRRVVQDEKTRGFIGQHWQPPAPFAWKNPVPARKGALRIYEAHVGMATEEYRVGTYNEFTAHVLPRIRHLGYNAVQLMAIQEHPYYGSFGYHVSNFYAASSRYGTPEDLKALVDAAHGMGLLVIMDLVHSHAIKNLNEGLNRFDGTEFQYFHAGPQGQHVAWDSLLFDYSKFEVQRFLLSNVRFWLEEFHFDGYRFDGITSMMYRDHGLGLKVNSYDVYFGPGIDYDAVAYLQLANQVAHSVHVEQPPTAVFQRTDEGVCATPADPMMTRAHPAIITIAEDVSGMVGLARPVAEGGLGFDYRLAMGVPDYWIKVLKERRDEDWNINDLYQMLMNRRRAEKHIAYAESHDQALVGDKTLAFWLMDQAMYWHMHKDDPDLVVARGLALHKMIRLVTFSLGGEAYLNFMGNEFGHPEWVDFPREGNGWSYQYARRQWSLVDNPNLRYRLLNEFDRAMQKLDEDWNLLEDPFIEQLALHEREKQLVFRRGPLVFVFNFHPSASCSDWRIPVPDPKDYRLILNTDNKAFGGHGLVQEPIVYPRQNVPLYSRQQSIQLYVPARSAQVLAPV